MYCDTLILNTNNIWSHRQDANRIKAGNESYKGGVHGANERLYVVKIAHHAK